MRLSAKPVDLGAIMPWRDMYRREMACQIIHDSIHSRMGWSTEYALFKDSVRVGYGSVAVAGPWKDKPTIYEFYVVPSHRLHSFALFSELLAASGAVMIETQSNDPSLTNMLHVFAEHVESEAILFEDSVVTHYAPPGARFRGSTADDGLDASPDQLPWHGVVEVNGERAATGGILFHYNRPYGDIYMDVVAAFRRRGIGTFIVQELKRVCYEGGYVPGARCGRDNVASRHTLQRAGFVPCGHILHGDVAKRA